MATQKRPKKGKIPSSHEKSYNLRQVLIVIEKIS